MSADIQWFAAYVRSRHEDRVAQYLAARTVEFFLPQYKSERKWRDRKITPSLPLFPGYLFVRISREQRLDVLLSPGVIRLVGASGHPEPLQDGEIDQLKMAVSRGKDPRPHVFIAAGDRVVIIQGRLEGYEGFLVREKNRNRVVISLDLINRAISIEVDASEIAPVPTWRSRSGGRYQASA